MGRGRSTGRLSRWHYLLARIGSYWHLLGMGTTCGTTPVLAATTAERGYIPLLRFCIERGRSKGSKKGGLHTNTMPVSPGAAGSCFSRLRPGLHPVAWQHTRNKDALRRCC
jgi:hypothetical protein